MEPPCCELIEAPGECTFGEGFMNKLAKNLADTEGYPALSFSLRHGPDIGMMAC